MPISSPKVVSPITLANPGPTLSPGDHRRRGLRALRHGEGVLPAAAGQQAALHRPRVPLSTSWPRQGRAYGTGLSRIVALYHRSSTPHRLREHILCLYL